MDGMGFRLKDRLAARRADKVVGAMEASSMQGMAQPQTGTRPATGNVLNQRQNLFKQMETAGSGGITPAMRSQARSLGVADNDFNTAAEKVRVNSLYTPGANPAPKKKSGTPPSTPPSSVPLKPRDTALRDKINKMYDPDAYKRNGDKPPTAPRYGKDVATANIAKLGQTGAAKDYLARSAAEKAAGEATTQAKVIDTAVAKPQAYSPTPSADPAISPSQRGTPVTSSSKKPQVTAAAPRPTMEMSPAPKLSTASNQGESDDYGGNVEMKTPSTKKTPLRLAMSSGATFSNPAAEAKRSNVAAAARMKANDEKIKKRRAGQSSGPFARDSLMGGAMRWLQNDNFSTR